MNRRFSLRSSLGAHTASIDFKLPTMRLLIRPLIAVLCAGFLASAQGADTTPDQQLARWSAQAGAPANAERGRVFFASRHGGEWSCASCHGTPPTAGGKHASTGKPIEPLAPAFNPRAFTDQAKVDKWFKRNCKDVLSRECSAAEKADVIAYLNSLK